MAGRLRWLSNAEVRDQGTAIALTIERQDGHQLTVSCPLAEIGDIFSFLAQAARAAGEAKADRRSLSEQVYFAPVPIEGFGFAAGRTPDETLLVTNIAGFGLALAVPNNALVAEFGRDLARTAATLSTSSNALWFFFDNEAVSSETVKTGAAARSAAPARIASHCLTASPRLKIAQKTD
jgi:hypothetical protein